MNEKTSRELDELFNSIWTYDGSEAVGAQTMNVPDHAIDDNQTGSTSLIGISCSLASPHIQDTACMNQSHIESNLDQDQALNIQKTVYPKDQAQVSLFD